MTFNTDWTEIKHLEQEMPLALYIRAATFKNFFTKVEWMTY